MIENRRIRESAPIRKSMSMSENDALRAEELERIFSQRFPNECPFSFSKTISKALEIAYFAVKDTQETVRPPVQENRTLAESQTTLNLETQEVARPPTQEKPCSDVKEIGTNAQKNKPSKLAKKWKNR